MWRSLSRGLRGGRPGSRGQRDFSRGDQGAAAPLSGGWPPALLFTACVEPWPRPQGRAGGEAARAGAPPTPAAGLTPRTTCFPVYVQVFSALIVIISGAFVITIIYRSVVSPRPNSPAEGAGRRVLGSGWGVLSAPQLLTAPLPPAFQEHPPCQPPTCPFARERPAWCVLSRCRRVLGDESALPVWWGQVARATGGRPQAGPDSLLPLGAKVPPPATSPLVTWRKASETSQVSLSSSQENQSLLWCQGMSCVTCLHRHTLPVPVLTLRSLDATHDRVFGACIRI